MINFIQIQEQIQRDLAKTDLFADVDDYGASNLTDGTIAFYVKEAIRFYSRRRVAFNEKTATLNADGTNEIALPSDFVRDIEIVNNENEDPLTKKTLSHILNRSTDFDGDLLNPEFYCIFQNKVRFTDNVSSGESFTLYYTYRLAELEVSTDTNEWINECNAAIRARAMGDIFAFKRRSTQDAQVMYQLADAYMQEIQGLYSEQQSSGTIEANEV